jgi:hypothetical protein
MCGTTAFYKAGLWYPRNPHTNVANYFYSTIVTFLPRFPEVLGNTDAGGRSCLPTSARLTLCRASPQFFLHPTWGKTFRAPCQGNDNLANSRFAQDSTLTQVANRD